MVKLGWHDVRPNDFTSPDTRPLRDLFGNLQKFMTWPHAGVTLGGTVDATYTDATLTAINAPLGLNEYNLVRNDTIQTPRDFNSYLAVGAAAAAITTNGAGQYQIGWRLNNATTTWRLALNITAGALVTIVVPFIKPVKKGDFLSIGANAPAATSFTETSEAYIFFLPLV